MAGFAILTVLGSAYICIWPAMSMARSLIISNGMDSSKMTKPEFTPHRTEKSRRICLTSRLYASRPLNTSVAARAAPSTVGSRS